MTTLNFIGAPPPAVTTSFTDKWVSSASGVALPTGARIAANGNRPVYVATAGCYWAGNGASRRLKLSIGGSASAWRTVASAGSASSSGQIAIGAVFINGGTKSVRIDSDNGSFYFGRESGTGSVDSYGTSFGLLSGSLEYYEVPTAPSAVSVVQAALENAVNVTWSAPSNNGGSAVTSYTLQWSYDSSFTGATTIVTGSSATSYKITNLAYGSTVYVKVAAVNIVATAAGTTSVFSSSAFGYVIPPNLPLNGWANFGSHGHSTFELTHTVIPALVPETGIQRKSTSTSATGNYAIGNFGIEKTYTDLIVGRSYVLTGKAILLATAPPGNIYRFAVNGIGNGSSVTLTSTSVGATIPSYTFTATSTTHTVQIELAESVNAIVGIMEHVAFYDFALTRTAVDLPYRLQDNLNQSSLLNHFDIATQSVGAQWWVDKNNVTRFTQNFNYVSPTCVFSDIVGEGNLYFNSIAAAFDTSGIVNSITMTNFGVTSAAYGAEKVEAYEVQWTENDTASVDEWGARNYALETNLRTAASRYNHVTNPHLAYGSDDIAFPNSNTSFSRALLSDMTTGATRFLTAGTTQPADGIGNYIGVITCSALKTSLAIIYTGNEKQQYNYGAFPVRPSTQYTGSAWVRGGVGQASMNANMTIRWFDIDGNDISTVNGTNTTLTSTAWGRRTVTATSPANAYSANLITNFGFTGGNNTGNRYFVTGALFEEGATAGTWFSGDNPDTATYFYEWEGTPGASRSVRYDNTVDNRALELLEEFANPSVTIRNLTWNTAQNPVVAAQLDIGSIVTITFKGATDNYRVVGIDHNATPDNWLMTLQVAKEN
jgi:hypothetical protein